MITSLHCVIGVMNALNDLWHHVCFPLVNALSEFVAPIDVQVVG